MLVCGLGIWRTRQQIQMAAHLHVKQLGVRRRMLGSNALRQVSARTVLA